MSSEISKIWEWELIPQHIIEVIFSKLSIANLPSYRLVSRTWNHMVLDYANSRSKFIPNTYILFKSRRNDKRSSFLWAPSKDMQCIDLDEKYSLEMNVLVGSFRFSSDYFDIRISNSCNGLLCVVNGMNYRRTCAGILNPMTSEYIKLPGNPDFFDKIYFYGFGFSSQMKHYKVARVSYTTPSYGCVVEIFTLGQENSKWRHLKFFSFTIENDGVYFNGALYWVGLDEKQNRIICRLDVEDESFEIIPLPNPRCYCAAIGVLNGDLYTTFRVESGDYKFEAWTMQNHGRKDKDSCMKKFVVDDFPQDWKFKLEGMACKQHLQLIKAFENGEILCLFNNLYLFSYNPETGKIKAYEQQDQTNFWIYQIESINFDSLHNILLGG